MLELLFAFGAGVAASSWLHLKGRRARKGGQAAKGQPAPLVLRPQHGPLSGAERAAVIHMSLPPEVSASIFGKMEAREAEAIALQITALPSISASLRQQVLSEFAGSLGIAESRLEEASQQEPALIAKALSTLASLKPVAHSR